MNLNEIMTDADIETLQKLSTDLVALYQKYGIDGYVDVVRDILRHDRHTGSINTQDW